MTARGVGPAAAALILAPGNCPGGTEAESRENRIALKGGLDFVNGQYDEVTVAVIDARGCVKVQQRVHGPFMNPVGEKPSVLGTLTGPTRTLLRQVKRLLGGKCAVFYAGSVASP